MKNQKDKIKKILIGIIIGVFTLPTIALGSSFTVSLIQGKTPAEAVEILAQQIDFLIARVEIVETKQIEIETEQAEVKTKQTEQEQTISEHQAIIQQQQALIEQQQKEILCQKLLEQTPQRGGISYMNKDIVKFYQNAQNELSSRQQILLNCPSLAQYTLEECDQWIEELRQKYGFEMAEEEEEETPETPEGQLEKYLQEKFEHPCFKCFPEISNTGYSLLSKISFWQSILQEAQPMYDQYIETCGLSK